MFCLEKVPSIFQEEWSHMIMKEMCTTKVKLCTKSGGLEHARHMFHNRAAWLLAPDRRLEKLKIFMGI